MIAITGGGTGGHLKVAKAVKNELNKRGIKPVFIGSTYGQDQKWFKKDKGFSKAYFLESTGVVNKKGLNKINSFLNILKLSFKAKKILKKHKIQKVFSVGGFSAAPAAFAAILYQKELFIHEQNAQTGSLNKLLKPFSKRFFNTFLHNDPYPVEEIFFQRRIRKKVKTVIFLGGSQGAKAINNLAFDIAETLDQKGIKIIHQCGSKEYEKTKNFYKTHKINADFFDFDPNLIEKIKKADLAISRAGASTLFELTANNLPAIYIPYPYAAGDHQYYNAKFLADKKASFLFREDQIDKKQILNILNMNLEEYSENLNKISIVDGAEYIVNELLK